MRRRIRERKEGGAAGRRREGEVGESERRRVECFLYDGEMAEGDDSEVVEQEDRGMGRIVGREEVRMSGEEKERRFSPSREEEEVEFASVG